MAIYFIFAKNLWRAENTVFLFSTSFFVVKARPTASPPPDRKSPPKRTKEAAFVAKRRVFCNICKHQQRLLTMTATRKKCQKKLQKSVDNEI